MAQVESILKTPASEMTDDKLESATKLLQGLLMQARDALKEVNDEIKKRKKLNKNRKVH